MKDADSRPLADVASRRFPLRKPQVISQRAGRDTLLYDRAADQVHLLNPVAAAIWAQCDGRHAADEIAAGLARGFAGTAGHDLAADVTAALVAFAARGLLCQEAQDGAS
jgi:hypothetical protein